MGLHNGMNTKFSVCIPAYKSMFLKQCIDSILNQTYSHFELIIINDCSPNPIDQVVSKYQDNRIRYFKNDSNIGSENVVDNWNKCLYNASGEFVVLMGDDDEMEPNYLEEFVALIIKFPNLDVYHCRSKIINQHGNAIGLTPSWPEFESVYDNIWHRINGHRLQFISDFLYRTVALKNEGGFYKLPLAWGSDDISAYRACGVKGIAHTNKAVFKYRSHEQSISSSGDNQLKLVAISGQMQWYTDFLNTQPFATDDSIQYNALKKNIYKLIQKKKIQVIATSVNFPFLGGLFNWIKMRKKYDYSIKELAYAVLEGLKQRMVLSKYKK